VLLAGCPGTGGEPSSPKQDDDRDGYVDGDCAPAAAAVNPGAIEMCDDTVDNDCDGQADGEDGDCKAEPRALTMLGSGRVRFAVYHGPEHDLILEVDVAPAPPSGAELLTDPARIDQLATPGGRAGAFRVVEVLHARHLIPDGPYRVDLNATADWLLFGAGDDYYLAWMRVERPDPVQVVEIACKDPLPDRPMRVPLPVRALRTGEVFEIDLGGGVVRSVQVMTQPIPARGW
jgi:hypothetical protein